MIYVKTLSLQTYHINASATDTVKDVKMQIEKETYIPCNMQKLMYLGKQLKNEQTLGQCNIKKFDTIYLVLRLKQGCFLPDTKAHIVILFYFFFIFFNFLFFFFPCV